MTNCKEFALTRKLDYLYKVKILRGGKSTDCLSPWSLPTIGRREKKTWARSSFGSLQETYDPVNVESRSLALTTRPPILQSSLQPWCPMACVYTYKCPTPKPTSPPCYSRVFERPATLIVDSKATDAEGVCANKTNERGTSVEIAKQKKKIGLPRVS